MWWPLTLPEKNESALYAERVLTQADLPDTLHTAYWDGETFHLSRASARRHREVTLPLSELLSRGCYGCTRRAPLAEEEAALRSVVGIAFEESYLYSKIFPCLQGECQNDPNILTRALVSYERIEEEVSSPTTLPDEIQALLTRKREALRQQFVAELRSPRISHYLAEYLPRRLWDAPHPQVPGNAVLLTYRRGDSSPVDLAVLTWGEAASGEKVLLEAPWSVVRWLDARGGSILDTSGMTPAQKDTLVSLWEPGSPDALGDPQKAAEAACSIC